MRWRLLKRRAVFLAFLASPCAAVDLKEKPPCIPWYSLGPARAFLASASRRRCICTPFVACRPHPSGNGAHDTATHSQQRESRAMPHTNAQVTPTPSHRPSARQHQSTSSGGPSRSPGPRHRRTHRRDHPHAATNALMLAAPEKKGWILGIPGILLRRNGSGEKTAVDPLGFFGLRRGFFPPTSRQRYALAPFCRLQATPKRPRRAPRGQRP